MKSVTTDPTAIQHPPPTSARTARHPPRDESVETRLYTTRERYRFQAPSTLLQIGEAGGVEAERYNPFSGRPDQKENRLVAVVAGLVGACDRDVEVARLLGCELGELDVEARQVSARDLLIELLGQNVDAEGEVLRRGPERDLGEDLVGERAGHDK